jgi:hypothetical protein
VCGINTSRPLRDACGSESCYNRCHALAARATSTASVSLHRSTLLRQVTLKRDVNYQTLLMREPLLPWLPLQLGACTAPRPSADPLLITRPGGLCRQPRRQRRCLRRHVRRPVLEL